MKQPLISVTHFTTKRPYRRGFTLRRIPRLTSTKASRSEMEFFASMIDALRAARLAKGLSQEATSQIVGVSEGMVAKWETGHKMPNSFWLMCWCQALGVQVRLA